MVSVQPVVGIFVLVFMVVMAGNWLFGTYDAEKKLQR
jgi:hypothetical protein